MKRFLRLWLLVVASIVMSLGSAPGLAAITLVTHANATGNINTVTSASANTTGANLIVISISWYIGGTAPVLTDNKSNTWTALTEHDANIISSVRMYYCVGGTVGTGHTFTATGTGSAPALCMTCYSGAASSPLDTQNGAGTSASGATLNTGSVTPAANGSLIVSGLCWDTSGQTAANSLGWSISDQSDGVSGVSMGASMAYLIQTTASAVNLQWSLTTGGNLAANVAVFKAATTGWVLAYDSGDMSLLTSGDPLPTYGGLSLTETLNTLAPTKQYVINDAGDGLGVGLRRTADGGQMEANRLVLDVGGTAHRQAKIEITWKASALSSTATLPNWTAVWGISNSGAFGSGHMYQGGYVASSTGPLSQAEWGAFADTAAGTTGSGAESYTLNASAQTDFQINNSGAFGMTTTFNGNPHADTISDGLVPTTGHGAILITGSSGASLSHLVITRLKISYDDYIDTTLRLTAAAGYPTVTGTHIAVAGPTKTGGVGASVSYAWYYTTTYNGTGTAISGQSGTITNAATAVPDLAWDVPSGQQNIPLWLYCTLSDGTTTYDAIGPWDTTHFAIGDTGSYIPAAAPVPAVPDNTALGALFDWSKVPSGKKVIFAQIGDSITFNSASAFTSDFAALDGASKHLAIDAGHSSSFIADWLPTAAATGTGQSILSGESTRNNYNGLKHYIDANKSTGDKIVISIMLGTNNGGNSTAEMADFDTLIAALQSDYADYNGVGTGSPPIVIHDQIYRWQTVNSNQLNQFQHETHYHGIVDASSSDKLIPGSRLTRLFFMAHAELSDLFLHPSISTGADDWARFVMAQQLQAAVSLYITTVQRRHTRSPRTGTRTSN